LVDRGRLTSVAIDDASTETAFCHYEDGIYPFLPRAFNILGSSSTSGAVFLPLPDVEDPGSLDHHDEQLVLETVEGDVEQGPVPVIVVILNTIKNLKP
jgi:hypothetical protein